MATKAAVPVKSVAKTAAKKPAAKAVEKKAFIPPVKSAPATKPVYKFPKTMGACADMIYTLRQSRLDAQKVVDKIESEEKALKEYIINNLPKSESTGVAGKLARVTAITKDIPQVKDWNKLYTYIKKNDRFDLLQRRTSDAGLQEILDAGKKVPGVEIFKAVTLSINKV